MPSEPYLPEYLSYSAVTRYEECPRSWYLAYARKAEEKQTWFFPMGTAVHVSIEKYLETGDVPDFKEIFYPLIEKQLIIDPDHRNWLSAGSGENVVQGALAVETGQRCVENAVKFLDDMDVWHVEYEMKQWLPGLEVPVKLFIDILGEHKKFGPRIVDWKSGKSKPNSIFQLEVYKACLVEADTETFKAGRFGPDGLWGEDFNGYWGMLHPEATPKTAKARCVDLSHVTPAEVGARMQKAYDGMKATIYKANKRFGCKFCIQQDNCKTFGAPIPTARQKYYDKSSEDGIPF